MPIDGNNMGFLRPLFGDATSLVILSDDSAKKLRGSMTKRDSDTLLQVTQYLLHNLNNPDFILTLQRAIQEGRIGTVNEKGKMNFRKDIADKLSPKSQFAVRNTTNSQVEHLTADIDHIDAETYMTAQKALDEFIEEAFPNKEKREKEESGERTTGANTTLSKAADVSARAPSRTTSKSTGNSQVPFALLEGEVIRKKMEKDREARQEERREARVEKDKEISSENNREDDLKAAIKQKAKAVDTTKRHIKNTEVRQKDK